MVLLTRSQIQQITERFIHQSSFLRFALIQDIVWMDFLVSDLKFNYICVKISPVTGVLSRTGSRIQAPVLSSEKNMDVVNG